MARFWNEKINRIDEMTAEIFNEAFDTIETELDNRVVKEQGKGLSSEDYTSEEKEKLAGLSDYDDTDIRAEINTLKNAKVDKVVGKGLSTEDYTTEEKQKLAGLENYDDSEIRAEVDQKLDKISTSTSRRQAYTKEADGSQSMINVDSAPSAGSLTERTSGGHIAVGSDLSLLEDGFAVPKSYVDNIGRLTPKSTETLSSGEITITPNNMTVIPTLTGETTITLGEAVEDYDNQWNFTITQGETAQTLVLPTIEWTLGIAPTFGKNTTTEIVLWYVGETLRGIWYE